MDDDKRTTADEFLIAAAKIKDEMDETNSEAETAAKEFVSAVGRSMDELEKRIVEVAGIENGDDAGLVIGRVTFSPEVERVRKGMMAGGRRENPPLNRPDPSLDELLDAFDGMDAETAAEAVEWTDPSKKVPTPTIGEGDVLADDALNEMYTPLPPVPEGTPAPQTGETLGDGMDGGGKRMNAGKLRIELIPPEWFVALADVMTQGSKKYEPRNWEKGMKWSTMIGSMKRHITKFEAGERYDGDGFDREKGTTGCHHLAMIAWNALALMTYDLLKKGTNDLPDNDGLALLKRVNAATSDKGNSIHDDDK